MTTYKEISDAVEKSADHFENLYLQYTDNFTSIEAFAERYGYNSTNKAAKDIGIGRKIHRQRMENSRG